MALWAICMCLKMSISHSIFHAASIFSIKIMSSLISLGSHKTNAFIYAGYVTISSPKTITPPKHLPISNESDLFQKNSET